MLEGNKLIGFISLRLHLGAVKEMKLNTGQGFAAQNPSTENIMSVLNKCKRKIYLSKGKPFLQRIISKQKKLKLRHSLSKVQFLTSVKKFDFTTEKLKKATNHDPNGRPKTSESLILRGFKA